MHNDGRPTIAWVSGIKAGVCRCVVVVADDDVDVVVGGAVAVVIAVSVSVSFSESVAVAVEVEVAFIVIIVAAAVDKEILPTVQLYTCRCEMLCKSRIIQILLSKPVRKRGVSYRCHPANAMI